jgi:hypothetical protein
MLSVSRGKALRVRKTRLNPTARHHYFLGGEIAAWPLAAWRVNRTTGCDGRDGWWELRTIRHGGFAPRRSSCYRVSLRGSRDNVQIAARRMGANLDRIDEVRE